ncbi:hypothetical protein HGRIS_005519 [Hohenbuehelia grisea]|uniref:Cupin type-2 domain-containing protein n=1 Tax=Hohenbuehelia grisea TaxID=104357 RepID=A0ABR3JX94_9AGAR
MTQTGSIKYSQRIKESVPSSSNIVDRLGGGCNFKSLHMALSLFVPKPTLIAPRRTEDGAIAYFGGAFKVSSIKDDEDGYTSWHILARGSPHSGVGRKSTSTPPYHWHIHQTETFEVKQGTMTYLFEGDEKKATKGDKVTITPGKKHTFWSDPESDEDLVVDITVRGGSGPGFDERLQRNLFGYLSSVTEQGSTPSLFQMLVFTDSAETALTDIPFGLGLWANVILGR